MSLVQKQVDHLASLPRELQQKILHYLDARDLTNFARVNKRWSRLAALNYVWWRLCMERWWEPQFRPSVYVACRHAIR